jgi:hypothetical protein
MQPVRGEEDLQNVQAASSSWAQWGVFGGKTERHDYAPATLEILSQELSLFAELRPKRSAPGRAMSRIRLSQGLQIRQIALAWTSSFALPSPEN